MPICKPIRGQRRQVCSGDMDRLITLQTRALTPSNTGVDATEQFVDVPGDVFAMIKTVTGETIFDGVNEERDVTHHFYIWAIDNLSSEIWVLFNDERLDVLSVEDLDERHMFMLLRATNRGLSSQEASGA